MLYYQEQQTGKRDITVFERNLTAFAISGGFNWMNTEEGKRIWSRVIFDREYHLIK